MKNEVKEILEKNTEIFLKKYLDKHNCYLQCDNLSSENPDITILTNDYNKIVGMHSTFEVFVKVYGAALDKEYKETGESNKDSIVLLKKLSDIYTYTGNILTLIADNEELFESDDEDFVLPGYDRFRRHLLLNISEIHNLFPYFWEFNSNALKTKINDNSRHWCNVIFDDIYNLQSNIHNSYANSDRFYKLYFELSQNALQLVKVAQSLDKVILDYSKSLKKDKLLNKYLLDYLNMDIFNAVLLKVYIDNENKKSA